MTTANMDREKVLKRIAKLLNLGDSAKNSNEHEAQAALLKAQEMMAANNISMSDLGMFEAPKKKEIGHVGTDTRIKLQWFHHAVARVIADNFRCYHYYSSWNGKSRMVFMGMKADAELAQTMYDFALIALDWNAEEYVKEQRKQRYIRDAKGIKTDYMRGFIRGLSEKFKEQEKMKVKQTILDDEGNATGQTQTVSMALVLVKDDALVKAHKEMKFKKGHASQGGQTTAGDAQAFAAGKEKGKAFEAASGFLS